MTTTLTTYDPATTWLIPPHTTTDPTQITIGIEPAGGGTPGRAYANNTWHYEIRVDGELALTGHDLESGAIPKTAYGMAQMLANFLSVVADTPSILRTYEPHEQVFIRVHAERLAVWADDTDDEL